MFVFVSKTQNNNEQTRNTSKNVIVLNAEYEVILQIVNLLIMAKFGLFYMI